MRLKENGLKLGGERIGSAALFILAGLFLIGIFTLTTTGHQSFFLKEKINVPLTRSIYANFLPGWGHFLLNGCALVISSFIELKERKNWSYFINLIGLVWIAGFDFIATRLYIDILPTPIFPGFCLMLGIWISRKNLFMPEKRSFAEMSAKARLGVLYGLSVFALGLIPLLGAMCYKFIPVDLPYAGKEKDLLLAIGHVGWANFSGYGLVIIYLFKFEEELKSRAISIIINVQCSISFLILLIASILEPTLRLYFLIPLVLIVLILTKTIFNRIKTFPNA